MSSLPFKILGIEHVGIAALKNDTADLFFNKLLGINRSCVEEVFDQKVTTDILDTGNGKVELLYSTEPDSIINKFIDKNGVGIHHLAFLVDDIKAALKYLNLRGVKIINKKPTLGAEGFKIAFIHPISTGGILVELCEK